MLHYTLICIVCMGTDALVEGRLPRPAMEEGLDGPFQIELASDDTELVLLSLVRVILVGDPAPWLERALVLRVAC